jgi:tRNA(adenine34) deaminase
MESESAPETFAPSATALRLMRRCIGLSSHAVEHGELPFAAVIARGEDIIVEATNRTRADADVTRHAELVAICAAQKKLGRTSLDGLALYTNAEPCACCSYAAREARLSAVYFGLTSPLMGGVTRWDVLGDAQLSARLPKVFAPPPLIVAGFLADEADAALRRAAPLIWAGSRLRGFFVPATVSVQALTSTVPQKLVGWAMKRLRAALFDRIASRN